MLKSMNEIHLCNNDIHCEATENLCMAIFHWNLPITLQIDKNCFTRKYLSLINLLLDDIQELKIDDNFKLCFYFC